MSIGWNDLFAYFYAGEGSHDGPDGTVLDFVHLPYLSGTFGNGEAPAFNAEIEDLVHVPGPTYGKVYGPQRMKGFPLGGVTVDKNTGAMTFTADMPIASSGGSKTFKGQPLLSSSHDRAFNLDDILTVSGDGISDAGETVAAFLPAIDWTLLSTLDEFGTYTLAPADVLAFDPQGQGQPFTVMPAVTMRFTTAGGGISLPYP